MFMFQCGVLRTEFAPTNGLRMALRRLHLQLDDAG
jgi:hypothetical protein